MWVKREVQFALQQNRYADKIVSLLYRPCESDKLSWVLSSLQAVDFQQPFQEGYRDLLRVWGMGFQPTE